MESALHTEIHRYRLDGEEHIANSTDIAIPAALAPVVSGVVSLHNFRHRSFSHVVRSNASRPLDNVGSSHDLAPYDFATIYNVGPLWSSGIDGAGQTIAIPGRSNIKLSDITTFRTTFGLPANNPKITVNGADPGVGSSDEEESDLDVEWSGAVAKGAVVKFVVSKSTAATDGVDLSATFIVNDNTASVISMSYSNCEAFLGSDNQFYDDLWAQAASQGMSVFVSAGDNGSAACDVPQSLFFGYNITNPASQGFAVNGLASTPNNVAVGGTQFNDVASPSTYWNSTNDSNLASAKGYIPEVVWNESIYTVFEGSNNGLWASSGGVSSLYPTPAWQTGPGVPSEDPGASAQHHRYLPDVSLAGALHDGYQIFQEGKVQTVGGTSAASPALAGIMALINQYTGGRNGNPNPYFYALAANAPSVYHDVTSGTNAVPCVGGSPNCSTAAPTVGVMTGYSAGAGFDLATGWGSVDAYALAQNWIANGPSNPVIASLNSNPMSASSSAQTLTINGSGFRPGATVKVGSATIAGAQVTFVGPVQLQVSVTESSPGGQAVQVINSDNHSSNTVTLQVLILGPPPSIASLTPNPMSGSNSPQTLTITGSGFLGGLTLQIGSTTYSSAQLQSVSATQIQKSLVFTTATRSLLVKVTNPDGQSSNSATLQVNAPAGQFAQQGAKLVGNDSVGAAQQGYSVAVSSDGNTAILGGSNDNSSAGAAWIFTRSNGAWTQQGAKLVGTGATGATQQGYSVAISSDGNTAVVGGPADKTGIGGVWIFIRTNGAWTQQGSELVGAGAVGQSQQGKSVAISGDGNTVVVGGWWDNGDIGAAWVYTRTNGVWTQQGAKLAGTGASGLAEQGSSVAISGDGNTAMVTGSADNSSTSANWVYTRTNGVWTQQGTKLVGGGASVALSNDGSTAIVGASGARALVFSRVNGFWSTVATLTIGVGRLTAAISGDGNTAILGASQYGVSGAAWVFKQTNGVWSQFGDRMVGDDSAGFSLEGTSVSISADGTTAMVGGPGDASSAGAAWVDVLITGPQISAGGVTNAAIPLVTLARGALASAYGSSLTAPGVSAQAGSLPLPLTLGGTSITVGGVPAPLYYVSPGQINFQVPFEVPPGPSAAVVAVNAAGVASPPVTVAMADYALGVFGYYRTASAFDPILTHLDYSLVSPSTPAMPGEIVVAWATGIGKLTNLPASGAGAPGAPLCKAVDTPNVTVGGLPAQVVFAGLSPGGVGLAQIDIQLPAVLPSASAGTLPMVIQFPGDSSPAVDLYYVPSPMPDLTITKTHTGTFTQSQTGANYVIIATNTGTAPTSGPVTVTEFLPAGLTATAVAGTGWTCAQPSGPCNRSDVLAAGVSFPAILLTVNVAANAAANLTNTVSVAGGGETNTGNDTATDPTIISQTGTGAPDLTITKVHNGNFTPGQTGAVYTITVSNIGTVGTSGLVFVADTLPSGLSGTAIAGTGWACAQPSGPCTRSDVLAPGASFPAITLTVNIAANAPSTVTNTATVGGGGEANTANDTASDPTIIGQSTNASFVIGALAGNGIQGFSGDGGLAIAAQFNLALSLAPGGIAVDASGTVYLADSLNHRVRKVTPAGIISTIAGTGTAGFSGDGGPALSAQLNEPAGLALDSQGNLYIADSKNGSIRKVAPGGTISTVAGTGSAGGFAGDGGQATLATFYFVYGVAVDAAGSLYIADTFNHRVRKVTSDGVIHTIAGNGIPGFGGDGGAAAQAQMYNPFTLTLDGSGNLYIVDAHNNRIRKVSTSGIISTFAGNGSPTFGGDGGQAVSASLNFSTSGVSGGVAVDSAGNLYVADANNNRVREVTPAGIINTVAGIGTFGNTGDGGAALAAGLDQPNNLAIDAAGNLYLADKYNNRFRKLTLVH